MTEEEKKAKREKIKAKYKEFMKVYPLNPQSLIDEIWTWVEGYEGRYQISNYGRVKNFYRNKERILIPKQNGNGYLHVCLTKNNSHKTVYIHILVAKAFIPNPENKPQVNHEDGDKFNCHVGNLKWQTQSENIKHAIYNGLMKGLRGEKSVSAKLTNEQARFCKDFYISGDREYGLSALSRKFGVSTGCMSDILRGRTYKDA
ncbi:MAG: NUMOD4 motif-containing HNH endonuclease [Selenomonadaceae bacterium]|nr:NUMOD4 motif-containing HNH endonuclease [Selenomonadaceae bacterium]